MWNVNYGQISINHDAIDALHMNISGDINLGILSSLGIPRDCFETIYHAYPDEHEMTLLKVTNDISQHVTVLWWLNLPSTAANVLMIIL